MSRVLLWIVSAVLALLGLTSMVAAGASALALSDPAALSTTLPPLRSSADAHAIVIDIEGTAASVNGITLPGTVSVRLDADQALSAGITDPASADALLATTAYDSATLVDGAWVLRSVPAPGDAALASAPWMQTGDAMALTASRGTLVIMNADGGAGVSTSVSLALPADFADTLLVGLLILGGLLIVLAMTVGVIALAGTRHSAGR